MSNSRNVEKNFLKSLNSYENVLELVSRAVNPTKPTLVKSLAQNSKELKEAYSDLSFTWKEYKKDLKVDAAVFNGVDTAGKPNYEHNESWFNLLKDGYFDLLEKSDNKLDEISMEKGDKSVVNQALVDQESKQKEACQNKKYVECLNNQIESLTNSISSSLDKIHAEVNSMSDCGESVMRVQSLKGDINSLDIKLDESFNKLYSEYICLIPDHEVAEKESLRSNFITKEKSRISNILLLLSKKTKDPPTTVTSPTATYPVTSGDSKQGAYLKRADPPKWLGDSLEFADFKRKWTNQVTSANMPQETELDRLRECIPSQAAKALFGETKMDQAWKVLEGLYGDKDLIANKLKKQLKGIKVKGKHDYDIVIDLVTDVKNIVLRLEALKADQMLHNDSEFMASVFRVLPSTSQVKWLDFDKSSHSSKWSAFMAFLEIARDQALQTKVLMSSYDHTTESAGGCHKCGKAGHKAKNCPDVKVNSAIVKSTDGKRDKMKEEKKKAKETAGKCPLCKERHTYTRVKDKEEWPSDRLFKCDQFKNMSIRDRASTLQRLSACPKCTSWNHVRADCVSQARCGILINGSKCNGEHSSLVCGSGNAYCGALHLKVDLNSSDSESDSSTFSSYSSQSLGLNSISSSSLASSDSVSSLSCDSLSSSSISSKSSVNSSTDGLCPDIFAETLLLFQEVPVVGSLQDANVCWDNGSNRCIVTHSYAAKCNMRKHDAVLRLDVVGQRGVSKDSCYYLFEFILNDGSTRKIWAYGLDEIMEPVSSIDLRGVRNLFPHVPNSVFRLQSKKKIDILMGSNFLGLHPYGGLGRDRVGDLIAYRSYFGEGWVIGGTHADLQINSPQLSSSSIHLARVNKCLVSPELLPSFWEGESLGVLCPKRCGRCLRCKECTDPALVHSRKNQEDLDMIRQGVKLENGKIQVSYYFSRDPHCLPNNRAQVVKMAEKQERRLIKAGRLEDYNAEIQKYIDRGGVIKLSEEELDNWSGPTQYISHHGVIQDSATTPLRVVTNSSLNNGGHSLNSCLPTGPNSLNPMVDIMIRFRCHEVAMLFDLSKAYNSLHTGLVERHLRRFVYRFNPEEDWADYAFDCVAFGDNPAANLLEIGRNMTADAGESIDPEAARKLKQDSYVDDNLSGGTREEVERMVGVMMDNGKFSGTMQQILDKGNLKAKVFVTSGEMDANVKNLIGNKALGYHWDATEDMMAVKFPIYLSNKRKKARSHPPLTVETLSLLDTTVFTKRLCLGITNGFLDFLGIACPFTLRFKLLMRELFETENKKLSWEDQIPESMVESWKLLVSEAVVSDGIFFPRCVRPNHAIGQPLVVCFADGAFPGFSACTYLQWKYSCSHGYTECDNDYDAQLLIAKARVTPLSGHTVPRSELAGTLLESRLALTTVKALHVEPSMAPNGVILLSDSKCSISAIDTSTRVLKPFFHNKVAEIIDNMLQMKKYCHVEDIHYVSSDLNPADLATRGNVLATDLGPFSYWQKGPTFLRSRRDLWPVSRDFVKEDVPEDEVRLSRKSVWAMHMRSYIAQIETGKNSSMVSDGLPALWSAISEVIHYSDSIDKVLGILARLIICWRLKAQEAEITKQALKTCSREDLISAERLLLVSAMPETATAVFDKTLLSLAPERDGNIIVTRGRIGEKCLSRLLGVSCLPILMPTSRAAFLYMVQAHRGEHGNVHHSISETLARSRQKVWIVRGRNLAKKVCSSCYLCKRMNQKLATQQMSQIKEESLTVCPPFTFISLDFAGPVIVKGAVNSRARMKCWLLVYCCRSTKAVEILPTCGYSTQDFLLRHEEFVSRHGIPQSIVSDRGSQLVSAGLVLAKRDGESPTDWNWEQITSKNQASNWQFVPIGSPHFNGLPESTVKVLKRTLKLSLHPGVILSYPELQTLLAKITYTVNSRPLGLSCVSGSSQQEDIIQPITPNMMLKVFVCVPAPII